MTRSGFVAIAGRPNVGKSTLVNTIVGQKVAIVSDKPQTTRRAVRGVATTPEWQLVLTDLPGVQRPRDTLTERMQRRVESELAEADVALLVLNAEQGVGPGDRFLAQILKGPVPVVVVVNKVDRARRPRVVETLSEAEELGIAEEIFPVSARTGAGVPTLVEHLAARVPEGPFHFPPEVRSDMSEAVALAELVREQVLARTRQEVPHAVEVEVDEVSDGYVRAYVWVETESQKGILIGAKGQMVRDIGTSARKEIQRRSGENVHLDLSVRVRRHWRGDANLLDRLGIE